jgi:hypothetical protein
MINTFNNSDQSLNSTSKDTNYQTDLQKVYNSFFEFPKTMKEVDKEIGVMRESICRHCRTLRENKQIIAIRKRRCKITGYPSVTEWTTNPDLFPSFKQLTLF